MTNDDGLLASGAGSTTVKRFLSEEHEQWPRVIRLGIEGITEERRKWLGKPISDEEIAACIEKARRIGAQLQLFWIIGFAGDEGPGSLVRVAQHLGAESLRFPRVYMKFTWFESSPHTPLGNYDLTQLVDWDYQSHSRCLRAVSGRYRVFAAGSQGLAVWSSVLRRLPREQAMEWYTYRERMRRSPLPLAIAVAKNICGTDLVAGTAIFPWKKILVGRKLLTGATPDDPVGQHGPLGCG